MEKNINQIIAQKIYFIRGHRVMLDSDLAELYGVGTKILNKAVSRNQKRFPPDFMFQLEFPELAALRFQFGTSNDAPGRGGRRYRPYVFTQEGVAMLSSVLNSEQAIEVNIEIMRAFVRLRAVLGNNRELAQKLAQLEQKYDSQFKEVFIAIRQLMALPEMPRRRVGFKW